MIAAGSRLGPYEITAPLGAGGMGEVYRARDGNRLLWASSRTGPYNFFWRAADNSTPEEHLVKSENNMSIRSFTPDGKSLLYSQGRPAPTSCSCSWRRGNPSR